MDIFVKNSADLDSAPFVGKVWTAVTNVWPDFTHPNATEYWTKQLQSYHSQVHGQNVFSIFKTRFLLNIFAWKFIFDFNFQKRNLLYNLLGGE